MLSSIVCKPYIFTNTVISIMDSRRPMKRYVKLPGLPEVSRQNVGTSRIIDTRIKAPQQHHTQTKSLLQKHNYQPQKSPILRQHTPTITQPPPILSQHPYIQTQQPHIQAHHNQINSHQPLFQSQPPLLQTQHPQQSHIQTQQPHIQVQQSHFQTQQSHVQSQHSQIQTHHTPTQQQQLHQPYPQEQYYTMQQHKSFIEGVKRLETATQRLESLVKILIERTNENNTMDLEDSTEVLADISIASREYLSRHKILR